MVRNHRVTSRVNSSRNIKYKYLKEVTSPDESISGDITQTTEASSERCILRQKSPFKYRHIDNDSPDQLETKPYINSGRMIIISSPSISRRKKGKDSRKGHDKLGTNQRHHIEDRVETIIDKQKRTKPSKLNGVKSGSHKHKQQERSLKSSKRISTEKMVKQNKNKDRKKKTQHTSTTDTLNLDENCPLCQKQFEFPILLRCAHTICKDCVTVFVETSNGDSFICPICETAIPLSGEDEELFCPNFVILQNMEKDNAIDDLVCSACDEDGPAEYGCEDCLDLLCEECKDAHGVVKFTKDHKIKAISSYKDISKFNRKRYFCTEHTNEQLSLHCTPCQQSICKQCSLHNHYGDKHQCIPIKEAANNCRENMQRKSYDIKSWTPALNIALMDVKRVKKLLSIQVDTVRHEITASIKRLINVLKQRENSLQNDVDQVYREKQTNLNAQKQQLTIELEQFEAATRILKQLGDHENGVEMLQMKMTIDKTLKSFEFERPHILIEEETFLLKSNEMDIKREIALHGQIQKNEVTNLDAKVTKESQSKRKRNREETNVIISSDFEESALVDYAPSCAKLQARKLRTKANWLMVRSRVPDIIKYGKSNGNFDENPSSKSENSLLYFCSGVHAKELKARSNWLVLISELTTQKPIGKKVISEIKTRKGNVQDTKTSRAFSCRDNPNKIPLKLAQKLREILGDGVPRKNRRHLAIRNRANANWLLVRAHLYDVVDYGRISGILPYNQAEFNLAYSAKRESRTILKLKRYRAITLRARSNWMLVKSRIKDIAQYPKKKQQQTSRLKLGASHLHNRVKAARNKQMAGTVRAKANWLIVKTRIPDIILFGKFRSHKSGKGNSKIFSEYFYQSQKSATLAKANSTPDLSSHENINNKPEKWDVLIHNGCSKPVEARIEFSQEITNGYAKNLKYLSCKSQSLESVCFESENQRDTCLEDQDQRGKRDGCKLPNESPSSSNRKRWNRVIVGSSFTKSNINDSTVSSERDDTSWGGLQINKTRKSLRSKNETKTKKSLEYWDILIRSPSLFQSGSPTKQTKFCKTSRGKENVAFDHWDLLIEMKNTERSDSRNGYFHSQKDAYYNWKQLLQGHIYGRSSEKQIFGIRRTRSIDFPMGKNSRVKDSGKAIGDWQKLIKEIEISKTNSARIHFPMRISSPGRVNSPIQRSRSSEDRVYSSKEKSGKGKNWKLEASSNWKALTENTKCSSTKRQENTKGQKVKLTPYQHWDILISDLPSPKGLPTTVIEKANKKIGKDWKFGANLNIRKGFPSGSVGDRKKNEKFSSANEREILNYWHFLINGLTLHSRFEQAIYDGQTRASRTESPGGFPGTRRTLSTERDSMKYWDYLIVNTKPSSEYQEKGMNPEKDTTAMKHWDHLIVKEDPSKDYPDTSRTGKNLLKEKDPLEHWVFLTTNIEALKDNSETNGKVKRSLKVEDSLKHWFHLIANIVITTHSGAKTKNISDLLTTSFDERESMWHWDCLIAGDIQKEQSGENTGTEKGKTSK